MKTGLPYEVFVQYTTIHKNVQLVLSKAKKIILHLDLRLSHLIKRFFKLNNINNVFVESKLPANNENSEKFISNSQKFIQVGSLPKYTLNTKQQFKKIKFPYLIPNSQLVKNFQNYNYCK